jgi:hypothetical protein
MVKVRLIIFIGKKTSLTIIASLDQMERYAREFYTSTAWHGDRLDGMGEGRLYLSLIVVCPP